MPSAAGGNTLSRTTSDIVILIARVALGVTLLAHGWQKFFTNTIDGTATFFESMDIPVAGTAWTTSSAVGGKLSRYRPRNP
jgi:putative oxidoreductase